MFEKLKKSAEVKIKEIVGNLEGTDILLLDKKDTGSKCYWEGFIEGLNSAEKNLMEKETKYEQFAEDIKRVMNKSMFPNDKLDIIQDFLRDL